MIRQVQRPGPFVSACSMRRAIARTDHTPCDRGRWRSWDAGYQWSFWSQGSRESYEEAGTKGTRTAGRFDCRHGADSDCRPFRRGVRAGLLRRGWSASCTCGQLHDRCASGRFGTCDHTPVLRSKSQASHPYVSNKPNPFAPCRTGVDDNGDGIYGGTHPGTAPVDIGAGSGTVWAQLDYLPAADKGGYAWVSDTSGACSSWSGSEATIYVYHYGPSATYYQHSISYQHINITLGLTNRWIAWNNSGATYPYWPQWAAEFKFGNQTAGGEAIGSIFNVVGGNPNCATANHLHQDGSNLTWNYWRWAEGCFQDSGYWGGSRCHSNPSIWAWVTGESVSQRYSDAQYTTIQVN